MNDSDKEKLMGQRIIIGADVTWELYWTVYKETPNHVEVLNKLKINIESDALEEIEALSGNPKASSYQAKFMQAVEELKVKNPEAIFGETTKLTRAATPTATQNKFEVEFADDEPDSYEMYAENILKPKLASPLQPLRDAAAKAKDKIATAFKIPTLPKIKKTSASVSKQNSPLQHFANEFAETENNREDNEFMAKWYGAQSALRDKSPKKNQEKNYRNIMDYAKALNNILKGSPGKNAGPEWIPDTKLMAPIQWMLAQEPNNAELKSLYAEIVANMIVARAVPGLDINQLIALKNIFAEAIATQNYMAAYDVVSILIDVTLKSVSDPTVIIYCDLLRQERSRLEFFQPPKATWTEAELMAEVEKQMADDKRNSQPFNINRKDDWDRYWDYYKQEMQGNDESNRDVRLAGHKAVCEKVGLDWNKYSEIIGIADKTFNQGFFEHFGADKYRQNYMIGFKKEFDKQFLFNAGKEKNHTAELELSLNSGPFVGNFSSPRFMEIMRVFCSSDEQARKVLQSAQTLAIYAQRIKDLPMTDPIAKAQAIMEIMREPQYLYAIAKFEAFRKGFYGNLEEAQRRELSQQFENAGFLQIGEDADIFLNVPYQLLPRFPITLKELAENLEKENENDPRVAVVRQIRADFEANVLRPFNQLVRVEQNFQDKELDTALVNLKGRLETVSGLDAQQRAQLQKNMETLLDNYLHHKKAATDPKIKKSVEVLSTLVAVFNQQTTLLDTLSNSDTESSGSSPRSTTPVTSESDDESTDDYDDADPVVVQAPGEFSQEIKLENMSKKTLAIQYQHMREAFTEGHFEKAKDLLTGIYAGMVEAKKPADLGGDELVDGLREIIELSRPTNFDVKMSNRFAEVYNDSGEVAYLAMSLSVAIGAVQQEGNLLLTSDNPTIEKYNKIHKLFESNPDPFTMKGPRDVVKVTRAYREIAQHDISTITNAILQDPALADAFFKRRLGTQLPGRRNFRKEFAEHPELIEKLISSRDQVILVSMRDTGLLQTSHLSEKNRFRLIEFNTFLNNESVLNDQEMLATAAENLEQMKPEETVADLIAELESHKLGQVSNNEHQQACMDILDKINNKQLANLLKEKFTQHPSEKFPDLNQMKMFVKDINDNMKIKNSVGLDYKRYLTMLTDSKYDVKFMGLFNLEKDNFPRNNKGFQRPLPPVASVQLKNADTPKPHHGAK